MTHSVAVASVRRFQLWNQLRDATSVAATAVDSSAPAAIEADVARVQYSDWFDWLTKMLISRHAVDRVRALQLLGETEPGVLAMYRRGVAFKLMDGDVRVRLVAFETLEKLLPTMIASHALIPLRRAQNTDSDPRVRIASTDTLREIQHAILNPQHGSRIISYTWPAMNLPTV